MCGACTKECVTGWDPTFFTKDVRLNAALNGKTPDYINAIVDKILDTGNAYGAKKVKAALDKAIKAHEKDEKVLLFLGSEARYNVPDAAVKAIEVLEKAGVKFTCLAKEPDSGAAFDWLIGAADETKKMMKDCADVIGKYKTIVVLIRLTPRRSSVSIRNTALSFDGVVTFTAYVAGLIKDKKLKVKNTGKAVVFQDPYQLARDLEETEEPREIVSACAELNEMLLNRKRHHVGRRLAHGYI